MIPWYLIWFMDSLNHNFNYMDQFFDLEIDYPSSSVPPHITQVQWSGVEVDAYSMSSAVISGTQRKNLVPNELETTDESRMKCKRLKLIPPTKQCVYVSAPQNSSPLGLTLRKTPSFLSLVESKLSHTKDPVSVLKPIENTDAGTVVSQSNGKIKASNFSASLLCIGSWEWLSRYDGDLVAKCYFAKRKLVWELLDSGLKKKIEVQWSDIASLKATCRNNDSQELEIELHKQPLFFRETNPQPRKHTIWKATTDFTDGQASIFRKHFLQFPQGMPRNQLEKLLKMDERLYSLSKNPYPSLDSPTFSSDILESQSPNGHKLFELGEQSSVTPKGFLMSEPTDDYLELLHCFTLNRTTGLQKYSNPDQTATSSERLYNSLGVTTNHPSHGMISTPNIFPSLSVSLLTSVPDFNTPGESYYNLDMILEEVTNDLMEDCHSTSLHSSKLNINSSRDGKPNYWIADVHNCQKTAGFAEDIGWGSEVDGYLSRYPYASDEVEDYDNYDFLRQVSGTMSFTDFVVSDERTTVIKVVESESSTSWI